MGVCGAACQRVSWGIPCLYWCKLSMKLPLGERESLWVVKGRVIDRMRELW